MLEIGKYVRKPFHIDAVRVTDENIGEVASWASGEVRTDSDGSKYVKVRVHHPLNPRQTQAYVGDWVLFAGTGYKVYTPKAFTNSFEPVPAESALPTEESIQNEAAAEARVRPRKPAKVVTSESSAEAS